MREWFSARGLAARGAIYGLAGSVFSRALSPGELVYAAVLLSLGCGYMVAAILLQRAGVC